MDIDRIDTSGWWPDEPTLVSREELARLIGFNIVKANPVYFRCECPFFAQEIWDAIEENLHLLKPFSLCRHFQQNIIEEIDTIRRRHPQIYMESSADVDFSLDTVTRRAVVKIVSMHWTFFDVRTFSNILPVGPGEFKASSTIRHEVNDDVTFLHLEIVMKNI